MNDPHEIPNWRRMRLASTLFDFCRAAWATIGIFVLCAAVTLYASHRIIHEEQRAAQREFANEATKVRRETERRFQLFEYGLYGTRGVFAASKSVERNEFRAYAQSRSLQHEFYGGMGFGYIERVPCDHLEAFEASMIAEGAPGFVVRNPRVGTENWVIKYLEPEGPNAAAIGFEVGFEPARRTALQQAMLTGKPTLTAKIQLVQDHQQRVGFLMALPVYRNGLPHDTAAERQAATQGWVYTPIVIDDVLQDIGDISDHLVDVEVFEGNEVDHDALLFDADRHLRKGGAKNPIDDSYQGRAFRQTAPIEVGGRSWIVTVSSQPGEFTADSTLANLVRYGGAVVTILISLLFWTVSRGRNHALALATSMTTEYQLSEQRAREATATAEHSLAELASHKHALDEHAVVAVTDPRGIITYANNKFCQLSQYSREELIGQHHRIVKSGYHPRQFWTDMWRTIARGNTWQGEVCNRAKDGSLYWVDTTIVPFRNGDGRIVQYVAIRTDITERKRAQAELDIAKNHLQAVLDSATEVSIIATDGQGTITEFSRGAEKMLGYAAEELIGKCSPALFHDADEVASRAAQLTEILERPISGFETFVALPRLNHAERREWTYITKSGGRKTVDLSVTAQRSTDGKIVGFLGTATDISMRKKVEQELRDYVEQIEDAKIRIEEKTCELQFQAEELWMQRERADAANQAKSEFLANMSHEIRTPLTAILGYTNLLGECAQESDGLTQREIIATIHNAGEHLLTIVNDILDLSKIEAGKLELEQVPTPLPQILRDVHRLLHQRARDKGVDLGVLLKTPIPTSIIGDATRLRQILMNLAGNAVKFTEAGHVTLSVSYLPGATGARLQVVVEDSGLGMTPAQAEQLFRPFTQADTSVTRKHGGTGLGLTISRRLGEMMGGEVSLVRTAPGAGSCFLLDIPCQAAGAAKFAATLVDATSNQVQPARLATLRGSILLAEDGPENQRLIALILRRAGATVDVADNGLIALQRYEQALAAGHPYDLLLSDMQMPVMDGYTLARTIRDGDGDLPIVALTANTMAEDRARCLAAGCSDFASKPIDKAGLLSLCDKLLRRRCLAVEG